ncbi:hypothetical protein GobsT_07630 [Gemmata obscuriglobus]|uniref:Uncharacterized protein n=1 Tax=Gemmata obscuriglobus TaxID=114 RepID=A0A2Z3HFX3_9BACT|nr:tetratricopeptide repeat protein [Gemmata obscuriglobus]AWM40704.1 hypothetical protein C1280_29440 [Gemmata obscuriglobus]QEG26028.1 hypothetical protein GobsT_07630 [Gemmata obscuriglobus]VTS00367.1 hypothetical protein : : TPR_16 [Gemmata obscuriglobus UQM 2246]
MARFILAACAVLVLAELAPARAQFACGPLCGPGYGFGGYSYTYRTGFGFSVGGPHFRVSGFAGGYVSRAVYYAPPLVPVSPFGPFGPVGLAPAPLVGFGRPVIVVPTPIILGGDFGRDTPEVVVAGAAPRDDGGLFPRGAKEGDFLVIAPKKRTAPAIARVADVRPGPVIAFNPFVAPVKVAMDRADPDPKKEAARQIGLARAAFAAADYGRAADHFTRASASDPGDARTYFLHAQAKFAAGEFVEAVARVRDGLARDPKWPAAPFDPTELYDGRADRYAAHLAALKNATADNPGQPALEFLLGYQLWFGGERAEAEKLFRTAERRLAAPGPIALFK